MAQNESAHFIIIIVIVLNTHESNQGERKREEAFLWPIEQPYEHSFYCDTNQMNFFLQENHTNKTRNNGEWQCACSTSINVQKHTFAHSFEASKRNLLSSFFTLYNLLLICIGK
jgi:hypothetical protein